MWSPCPCSQTVVWELATPIANLVSAVQCTSAENTQW